MILTNRYKNKYTIHEVDIYNLFQLFWFGDVMVNIVILTHGMFGEELFKASEMIVGKQDRVEILSIQDGSSVHDIATQLEAIITVNGQYGNIIFTDMFGGSPSNISIGFLDSGKCEVVSGVNLPMLIKVFSLRNNSDLSVHELALKTAKAGNDSIKVAGEILHKDISDSK